MKTVASRLALSFLWFVLMFGLAACGLGRHHCPDFPACTSQDPTTVADSGPGSPDAGALGASSWVVGFGASEHDYAHDIAIDSAGNS